MELIIFRRISPSHGIGLVAFAKHRMWKQALLLTHSTVHQALHAILRFTSRMRVAVGTLPEEAADAASFGYSSTYIKLHKDGSTRLNFPMPNYAP